MSGADMSSRPPPLRPLPGHDARVPPGEPPVSGNDADLDRRRRILAATAELVAKRGYHATTIELIVRRARIGYPAFYRCFEDKEAAFLALFDEAAAQIGELMRGAADQQDGRPWPRAVAAALRALFAAIAEQPLAARACLVEVLTAGPEAVARYEGALHELAPILLPGRSFNPRAAELSDTLEDTLAGGVAWIAYQRLVAGEAEQVPALLAETLEFVLTPYLGEAETARAVAELV